MKFSLTLVFLYGVVVAHIWNDLLSTVVNVSCFTPIVSFYCKVFLQF